MTLQQLRFLVEIAHRGFSVSEAALALNTSQPGISKQIRLLEGEISTQIFERRGKRLTGFTEEGRSIFTYAERVIQDANNIRRLGQEFNAEDVGELTVSTTPTLACHMLAPAIKSFTEMYPKVHLHLFVGEHDLAIDSVVSRESEIYIAPLIDEPPSDFVTLPAFKLQRSLVALPDNPLMKARKLSIEKIANFPIIAFETKSLSLKKVFGDHGLEPKYTITTSNPEVMKAYAALGLGVAVIATETYDAQRDAPLMARDVSDIFPAAEIMVGMRSSTYLRNYAYDFIRLIAPHLSRNRIDEQLHPPVIQVN